MVVLDAASPTTKHKQLQLNLPIHFIFYKENVRVCPIDAQKKAFVTTENKHAF